MSENKPRIYGVSELTREVKGLLESNFRGIWVRGEISEYNAQSGSGHVYLSLKDASSQIRVVYFRGAANCRGMGLGVGSEVEVFGRITVYEPQGAYQIQAETVRPVGMGSLRQQFEEMKARLRAEGLFDSDRKRQIPPFPNCVGVITSRDGAALQDFLNVLSRRHSGMNIRILPTVVQGKDAAGRMAAAIAYANQQKLCDVIVLTRGGGSLEDLWPFNEEVLARAIAASEIPLISAVGHERDFSISDFVADMRCATPSVAAEQVIAAKAQLMDRIDNYSKRLDNVMRYRLLEARRRFDQAISSPLMRNPQDLVNRAQQRVDMLTQRLAAQVPNRIAMANQRLANATNRLMSILPMMEANARHKLELLEGRLNAVSRAITQPRKERLARANYGLSALSPKNVLKRGYSIVFNEKEKAVRKPSDVRNGEHISAMLAEGRVSAIVCSDSSIE